MTFASASLDDLFEIARGGSPRPIDQYITDDDDGVNWIMISDASASSKYIERTKRRIKPSGVSKSRRVKPGDFLLTNSMSFGRPYILRTDGCIHDGWLVLSPKRNDVDPDYFYHLLGSDVLYAEFSRRAAGATVKNLNIDLVKGVEVTFPPIAEQKRIAAILDAADALRAKRRAALSKLDKLAQSIFIDMFGDPRTNFKRWSRKPLDEITPPSDRINYGVVQPGDDCEDGVPLVRAADVVNSIRDVASLKKIHPAIEADYARSRLKGDEILIACVGSVGAVCLANSELAGANIARAVARVRIDPTVCFRRFVSEQLQTQALQSYFQSEIRVVAQPTLNIKQIKEALIIVPPLVDQRKFCDACVHIDRQLEAAKSHLAQVDALFNSLQHRAFRGELTATDEAEIAA